MANRSPTVQINGTLQNIPSGDTLQIPAGFSPTTDNAQSIGSSTVRFAGVHATSLIARADATDTSKSTLAATSLSGSGAFSVDAVTSLLIGGAATGITIGNASAALTLNSSIVSLTGSLTAATGDQNAFSFSYTTNKLTSGDDTGIQISHTDTSSPGTSRFLDAFTNTVRTFSILNTGDVAFGDSASATITQTKKSGATNPAVNGLNLTIKAQDGKNVASGTNSSGGNLLLSSGAPGTGGSGTTSGNIQFQIGGTTALTLSFGATRALTFPGASQITSPTTFGISSPNFFFDGYITGRNIAATAAYYFIDTITAGRCSFLFGETVDGYIAHSPNIIDRAANNTFIQSDAPFPSAVTNKGSGNITLDIPAPLAGGTAGRTIFSNSGSTVLSIGTTGITAGADNLYGSGSASVRWSDSNSVQFSARADITNTIKSVLTSASLTATGNAFSITTNTGALSLNGTTGVNLQVAASTVASIGASSFTWVAGITNPSISQTQATAGSGTNSLITAQSGFGTGITDGGSLVLRGGARNSTGLKGGVSLSLNATTETMFEVTNLIDGQRVSSLNYGATLTTTQMPASTGDLVTFIGNTATAPTANPVSGSILYNESGNAKWRGPNGFVTTMAPTSATSVGTFGGHDVKVNTAQTTDNTPTTLITYTVPDNSTVDFYAKVNAKQSGGGNSSGYVRAATYKRAGGAATIVGTVTSVHTAEDNANLDVTFTTSTNDVLIQVTGDTGETYNWTGWVEILVRTPS